jgi:hypothetical protein
MRVKRAKKLFRSGTSNEPSRPGLFVLLIASIILVSGITGFIIFNHSEMAKESVERESQLYEQAKSQQNQTVVDNSGSDALPADPAQISDSPELNVTGTAIVYFAKYVESGDNDQQLASVERNIYQGQDPISSAVKELIAGPSSTEKAEGLFGGIGLNGDSNCNDQDFKIIAEDGSIKLQFCREYSDGGVSDDALQREQIIKTISGISGQSNILVLDKSGKCLFNQSLAGC